MPGVHNSVNPGEWVSFLTSEAMAQWEEEKAAFHSVTQRSFVLVVVVVGWCWLWAVFLILFHFGQSPTGLCALLPTQCSGEPCGLRNQIWASGVQSVCSGPQSCLSLPSFLSCPSCSSREPSSKPCVEAATSLGFRLVPGMGCFSWCVPVGLWLGAVSSALHGAFRAPLLGPFLSKVVVD